MKINAIAYSSHNLYGEGHRVSRLRENLTSGSEGEGLETDQNGTAPALYPPNLLQMDKAASAYKGVLQHVGKRSEDSNLDRNHGLRLGCVFVKKKLKLDMSLYTILQILSVTLFEKMPILQALSRTDYINQDTQSPKQLCLFD